MEDIVSGRKGRGVRRWIHDTKDTFRMKGHEAEEPARN